MTNRCNQSLIDDWKFCAYRLRIECSLLIGDNQGLINWFPIDYLSITYWFIDVIDCIPLETYTIIFREPRKSAFYHAVSHVNLWHSHDTPSTQYKKMLPAGYFITSFHTLQTKRLVAPEVAPAKQTQASQFALLFMLLCTVFNNLSPLIFFFTT